jgi:hypothetical protein
MPMSQAFPNQNTTFLTMCGNIPLTGRNGGRGFVKEKSLSELGV